MDKSIGALRSSLGLLQTFCIKVVRKRAEGFIDFMGLQNKGIFWIEGSTGQQRENSAQKHREEERVLHIFGDIL